MRLVVCLLKCSSADVRIDLCSHKTLVAQHFLNASNVRATIQQMRCKAVAERVGCRTRIQTAFLDVLF